MTQIETIIAEIERRMKNNQQDATESGAGAFYEDRQLLLFINSLPAEQPSEDLEKEIDRVIKEVVTPETLQDYIMGFKAGAQWQKEQMMKSAIDAVIVNDEMSGCVVDCEQGCLVLEPHTYAIGQKLKLLIIKEDE